MKSFCRIGIILALAVFAGAWAGWGSASAGPVPETGQTKCYDNTGEIPCPGPGEPFYGQDASYTIHPMSYTKLDGSGNALPIPHPPGPWCATMSPG